MAVCVKCNHKVELGLTRCPGCKASLMKPGAFVELLGWVVTVVSAIPIIIGEKTVEQGYYPAIIAGALVFVVGVVLIFVGRSKARAGEDTIRVEDAASGG